MLGLFSSERKWNSHCPPITTEQFYINLSAATAWVHYLPWLSVKYQSCKIPGAGTGTHQLLLIPKSCRVQHCSMDGFPRWHPLPRGGKWFPCGGKWFPQHWGWVVLRWPSLAGSIPSRMGDELLVDVALGRAPGACPQLGKSSSSGRGRGQNKHRNWGDPKGSFWGQELVGIGSWLWDSLIRGTQPRVEGAAHSSSASREAFLFPPAKQGQKGGVRRENKKC